MMRLTDCAKDGTLAYIAMGSNLGDREYYLREAVNRLAQESRIQVIAESSLYETEPVGYTEQGAFLNQVIAVRTTMTAHDLLYLLLDTERDLGRTREIRFGPRTLDLDLLLYVKMLPQRSGKADAGAGDGAGGRKSLQVLRHRRNTPEGQVRLKSLHYMNNILAKRELLAYPWAAGSEGLMLTEDGWIAEGIVSNVFFVQEDRIYTPSLDTGILPGITRDLVLSLAQRIGLPVEEGRYTLEQFQRADEIFITNSIQELVPVHQIWMPDGTVLPTGVSGGTSPGKVTRLLIEEYQRCIGSGL